jgi:beta-mannosidase
MASTDLARRTVDLGGEDWRLAKSPSDHPIAWEALDAVDEWLPARVPGNVRADLLRAGRIPDPYFGSQFRASQWVDDYAWWLVRDVACSPSADTRVHLILRGVDYICDLFLNGAHITRHEGMFSPLMFDITPHLGSENRLAIRLEANACLPTQRSNLLERCLNRVEGGISSLPEGFPERRDVLKCQMGFGWDFAPPVRSTGVWDDVCLHLSGHAFIRDVTTWSTFVGAAAKVNVRVDLDAATAGPVILRATLAGESFESEPSVAEVRTELPVGLSQHTLRLAVQEPRQWWPWDHGAPDLYRLRVEVLVAGSPPSDVWEGSVGLRTVTLKEWTLHVNGRPVYLRGANWVPPDLLPGRVAAADYEVLLGLAREANMNALRVWGGGLREKRAFYDTCDRLGILVWQEFPFACAFITRYPRRPEYLALVRNEVGAIVRDLRNHPALALWCGGNEFSPRRNAPLIGTLRAAVVEHDPTRPFLPVSPHGGDSHFWEVWHGWEPPAAYRQDLARFASEFGLQAPPDEASLRRFLPADEVWPPGPSWTAHGAELSKLHRYAAPWLGANAATPGAEREDGTVAEASPVRNQREESSPGELTLVQFIAASQRAQTEGLKIAIEHYRRQKEMGVGGALVWQFNEPWPAICWSLVDYYRGRKPAFETVQQLYAPVLISLDHLVRAYSPADRFCPNVWLINDSPTAFQGCDVQVELVDASGEVAQRYTGEADLPPLSTLVVARLCWTMPPGRGWHVRASARHQGALLTTNTYHLTRYDEIRPSWGRRLYGWLAGKVKAL